jgi:hypothetical protein
MATPVCSGGRIPRSRWSGSGSPGGDADSLLAVASYLRQDRPRCQTRRVFINAWAPRWGFAGSSTVGNIVRRALRRADLHPASKGAAHLFRHSLGTFLCAPGQRWGKSEKCSGIETSTQRKSTPKLTSRAYVPWLNPGPWEVHSEATRTGIERLPQP